MSLKQHIFILFKDKSGGSNKENMSETPNESKKGVGL